MDRGRTATSRTRSRRTARPSSPEIQAHLHRQKLDQDTTRHYRQPDHSWRRTTSTWPRHHHSVPHRRPTCGQRHRKDKPVLESTLRPGFNVHHGTGSRNSVTEAGRKWLRTQEDQLRPSTVHHYRVFAASSKSSERTWAATRDMPNQPLHKHEPHEPELTAWRKATPARSSRPR